MEPKGQEGQEGEKEQQVRNGTVTISGAGPGHLQAGAESPITRTSCSRSKDKKDEDREERQESHFHTFARTEVRECTRH